MKLYQATSLDDIAKQFRDNALQKLDQMNREIRKGDRVMLSREAITWNAAADILEDTELVPIGECVKE